MIISLLRPANSVCQPPSTRCSAISFKPIQQLAPQDIQHIVAVLAGFTSIAKDVGVETATIKAIQTMLDQRLSDNRALLG